MKPDGKMVIQEVRNGVGYFYHPLSHPPFRRHLTGILGPLGAGQGLRPDGDGRLRQAFVGLLPDVRGADGDGGALRALDPTNSGLAPNSWAEIAPKFADKSENQILSDIGLGKTLAIAVARSLLMQSDEKKVAENTQNSPEQLLIRGSEGMTLEFGICCNPIPGDPIIGHMKKGTGLIIHTHDCKTLSAPGTQNVKFLDVAWSENTDKMFTVKISLIVSDAQGVLAKVASEITKTDSNIQSAIAEPGDSSAYSSMIFTIQVGNRMHLATVMRSLRKIPAVIRINRLKSHQSL